MLRNHGFTGAGVKLMICSVSMFYHLIWQQVVRAVCGGDKRQDKRQLNIWIYKVTDIHYYSWFHNHFLGPPFPPHCLTASSQMRSRWRAFSSHAMFLDMQLFSQMYIYNPKTKTLWMLHGWTKNGVCFTLTIFHIQHYYINCDNIHRGIQISPLSSVEFRQTASNRKAEPD